MNISWISINSFFFLKKKKWSCVAAAADFVITSGDRALRCAHIGSMAGDRVGCCRRPQKLHVKIMWSQIARSTLFFRFQMPNAQTTSVYLPWYATLNAHVGCVLAQVGCIVALAVAAWAACTCCGYESVSTISLFHFAFITLCASINVISMHFKFFCLTLLARGSIRLNYFSVRDLFFCCFECPQQNTHNHYFLHERQTQERWIKKSRDLRAISHLEKKVERQCMAWRVHQADSAHSVIPFHRDVGRLAAVTHLCRIPRLCVRVVYMELAWVMTSDSQLNHVMCLLLIYKHFAQTPFESDSHERRISHKISIEFGSPIAATLIPNKSNSFSHFRTATKNWKQKY